MFKSILNSINKQHYFNFVDNLGYMFDKENGILGVIDYRNNTNEPILLFNKKLIPANYNCNNANEVLKIFIDNNLEPIFDDDKITALYRQIYIGKTLIAEKFDDINYKTLLENYEVDAISKSHVTRQRKEYFYLNGRSRS